MLAKVVHVKSKHVNLHESHGPNVLFKKNFGSSKGGIIYTLAAKGIVLSELVLVGYGKSKEVVIDLVGVKDKGKGNLMIIDPIIHDDSFDKELFGQYSSCILSC